MENLKPNLSQALLIELNMEAENTLKLLRAVPNEVLDYQPNDFNWTIAEHCAHLAEIYYWWDATLNQDHLEMSDYQYDKGDITDISHIIKRCEKNIDIARSILEDYPEENFFKNWRMTMNGVDMFPPARRIGVVRSFLMSHLYHHRGEILALLRVNHVPVPGLYGPTYEEMNPNA